MYTHNGILFRHAKEGNSDICDDMDWPWGYCAKWNKSDRERQVLYDLTYVGNLKKKNQTNRNREQSGGCQGLWCG